MFAKSTFDKDKASLAMILFYAVLLISLFDSTNSVAVTIRTTHTVDTNNATLTTCKCPVGYEGPRCEDCFPGYEKHQCNSHICVAIETKLEKFPRGANVVLRCPVPGTVVQWRRQDGKPLPQGSEIVDGLLRIPNFSIDYIGKYVCKIESQGKVAFGYIQIKVDEELMYMEITSTKDVVAVGESVTFACKVIGDPDARITWTKVAGQLPMESAVAGNQLTITVRSTAEGGTYRCNALARGNVRLNAEAGLQIGSRNFDEYETRP